MVIESSFPSVKLVKGSEVDESFFRQRCYLTPWLDVLSIWKIYLSALRLSEMYWLFSCPDGWERNQRLSVFAWFVIVNWNLLNTLPFCDVGILDSPEAIYNVTQSELDNSFHPKGFIRELRYAGEEINLHSRWLIYNYLKEDGLVSNQARWRELETICF